jgi:hypothetical protein
MRPKIATTAPAGGTVNVKDFTLGVSRVTVNTGVFVSDRTPICSFLYH